ncbi:DNA polymerase eta-like [Folsomia candida]|uniref:DNA polymerase eta-like n=1 Tax=Folsomia candida TaxID=158441 RepID=UPI001604F79D|nr:DNA polymerase eta-like [Folsomia candida]
MAKDNKFYAYKNQERLMFGALFMNKLCTHVENQTGLKSSAGVAKNKLMAKVACSLNKPGKITVLGDEAFRRVSSLVNISSIPGLGGSMGQELMETFSIVKVSKIFGIPFDQLKDKFGNIAAQNIYSWAQGRDVDPVVAKVMKDKIKVNKPAGDVRTLLRLESILYNLILEVGEILQEEESRYFRTTDTIRLEFNLAGDKKGFSEDFRISDKDKFNKILKCIVPTAKLQFDTDNVVTSLALVLKNFEPRRNQNSPKLNLDLDTSMQNLSLGLPNTLKVDTKSPPTASDLTFRHSPVGFFRITKDLTFSMESKDALPRLMELEDLHSLVGYNLFKAFNPATRPTVITDYTYYDEIKHRCFSEWLRLEGPKFKGKVQFISFHGRILRSLKTIWNQTFGEWDTYAMNVNGTIYLWDEKTPRPRSQSFHYARQFMGCLFENLTTGKGKDGLPEDDIEKVFVIQKVQFGTHTLLLLNNVDAQDSSGNYVQVTLSADQTEFKNNNASLVLELNLKLWAQAVVSGAERLVIGTKNKKNLLTRVQLLETDEFRATLMKREEMAKCFNFQDRLLTFIKIHLPEHDRKLVKKFSWCPGKHNVAVSTVPEEEVDNLLIPKIYLK